MNDVLLDRLVADFYSAAAGRCDWERPLEEMTAAIGGFVTHLIAIDKSRGEVVFSHIAGHVDVVKELAYVRRYHRIDPHVPALLKAPDIWWHSHEHISEQQVAVDPYYQEFFIPNGARWASGAKLLDDEELVVLLGLHRGLQQTPFDASAVAWLERLRTHLSNALLIHRHLLPVRRQAHAGRLLLDALPYPMFLIDARARLLHTNDAGRRLTNAADGLRVRDGYLGCEWSIDEAELLDGLAPLLRGEAHARSGLRVRRGHGNPPLGLSLSRLLPTEVLASFGDEPLALVVAHDSGSRKRPDRFLIAEVFGLTPAEADVGVLICEGLGAEDIANARNVSLSTVRTQIRTLLEKTGTSRQAALVGQLLALERLVP